MKQLLLIWIIVLFSLVRVNSIAFSDGIEEETYPGSMSKAEVTLREEMRLVWSRRAVLQREHIISVIESSDDASAARDALIANAGELGAAIRPFYGYWAGWRLTGILKKDVLLTEKVIEAAKSGNERKLEAVKEKWYQNAYALARLFFVPRNQTLEELTDLLYKHQDLTWGQIDARLQKNEREDLEYFRKDRKHMLMFSDVLTSGVVKQFPKKFKD